MIFSKRTIRTTSIPNKRAMLRSLGGGQIKKKHKNNGGQSQSFKNNNNNNKIIIINEKGQFGVHPPLWGANENFLAHSTEAKSLKATILNICAKIIKI